MRRDVSLSGIHRGEGFFLFACETKRSGLSVLGDWAVSGSAEESGKCWIFGAWDGWFIYDGEIGRADGGMR